MIFRNILFTFFAAISFASTSPAQTSAQNGDVFGDWRLACRAPTVGQSICNIFQVLTVTDTGAFLAEVSLQPVVIDGAKAVVLGLSTPTDMLLTIRPGYKTEAQSETLPLDWRTCSPEVCLASRVLQPGEVEALQAGQQMIMGYQSTKQATPLRFSVSLQGVTDGLSAMVQQVPSRQ